MKKWFESLNKTLRGFVCIAPFAVGGGLILLYAWLHNLILLILGIVFVALFVYFLALNGKIVQEKKDQLTEEEFERKKAEAREKAVSDAAKIPDSELDTQIEINEEKMNRHQRLIDESKSKEERAQNVYSALYYGSIALTLTERKKAMCKKAMSEPRELGQADELKKFKELLDDGVITQEEFQRKKEQILGIEPIDTTSNAERSLTPPSMKEIPQSTFSTLEKTTNNKIETVTVIDFETANHSFNSACSIGIAVIRGLEIVEKQYFLIQPPDNFYTNDNIAIHHITPEDTKDAEPFSAVWERIMKYFENTYLAAHNANFDMSVLKASLDFYHLEQPDFQYVNTIGVSSYGIKNPSEVGKTLDARCAYFGIPLENHHNALCDAVAAARLIICNAKLTRWKSAASFLRSNSSYFFDYKDVKIKTAQTFARYPKKIDINEIAAATAVNEETDADFNDKTFVITGEFKTMTREQALKIIVERGGAIKNSVSKHVDVLINADGRTSTKTQRAAELQAEGHQIRIVNEEQFLRMLENNDAIDWED